MLSKEINIREGEEKFAMYNLTAYGMNASHDAIIFASLLNANVCVCVVNRREEEAASDRGYINEATYIAHSSQLVSPC